MNIKQLKEVVDELFTARLTFVQLLQVIAENFYPERADFTIKRVHGNEFAADLMTSYPVLTRRDLGDQISSMLRPTEKHWFKMIPEHGEKVDNEGKRWLDRVTEIQRRAMYSKPAQFNRATKEGDQDFAAFGQCVISVRLNRFADNLLYRNFHIRDTVWQENAEAEIGLVARKWKPTLRDLVTIWGNKCSAKVVRRAEKKPLEKVKCYHIVVEADMYDGDSLGRPYWSIYYDAENQCLLEAVPVWDIEYVIPRWQTVSGSQYAYSPATITALPDARLIQAMSYSLLEASEKATNPPILATQDAIRSDVSLYAGGITWLDADYDEKMGTALRPMPLDLRGLPNGQESVRDSRDMIAQAFYLNKLTLPRDGVEKTAYEVGQIVQEYIRGALPIFQPMETEYNGGLCEKTFNILMRVGAFGSPHDIPKSLGGAVDFEYQSPLHDAIDAQKGQKFLESKALIAEALDIDPAAGHILNGSEALRDALTGIGTPAIWVNSREDVDDAVAQQKDDEAQSQQLALMQQSADVADTIGSASQSLGEQV